MRDKGKRTARHFDFGNACGRMLAAILPMHACPTAAATCRFYFHGKNHKGNQWGNGAVAYMQTFGIKPMVAPHAVQVGKEWVELDAHGSADIVLDCFDGITMDEVYNHYGKPEEQDCITVDLVDIVTALRPRIFGENQ